MPETDTQGSFTMPSEAYALPRQPKSYILPLDKSHFISAFFRGFAYFESNNSDALPWNTTKTGVDTSSKYFIYAKRLMQEATQQIIKECNQLIDGSLPDVVENTVFRSKKTLLTTASIISTANSNANFSLNVPEIKCAEPTATISFSKPKKMIDHMKSVMGVSTNKDVGITSFDYYYKRECEEYE